MSDGMFTMAEQCSQEFAESHEIALKSFLEAYATPPSNGEIVVEPVWQEHVAHKDFRYELKFIPSKSLVGFYEGKQDTWDTKNIVIELIGSVDSQIMEKFGVPFPSRSTKLTAEGTKAAYEKASDFINSCISGEQGDINMGYGSVDEEKVGGHPLFGYYRRPDERKSIDGRYRKTGNILSRTVCIYRGKKLRELAMKSFEEKKGFLQIVPNHRGYKYWASINLLIEASVFDEALIAKVHLSDDKTVERVEIIDKENS